MYGKHPWNDAPHRCYQFSAVGQEAFNPWCGSHIWNCQRMTGIHGMMRHTATPELLIHFRWVSIQSSMLRIHGMMHHTSVINSLPLGKHSIHDVAPTLGIANVRQASMDWCAIPELLIHFRWASIQSSMLTINAHWSHNHTALVQAFNLVVEHTWNFHRMMPHTSPDSSILAAGHAFNPWWPPHFQLVTGWSCVRSPLNFNTMRSDDPREDVVCGCDGRHFSLHIHPAIVMALTPCGVMSMLNINYVNLYKNGVLLEQLSCDNCHKKDLSFTKGLCIFTRKWCFLNNFLVIICHKKYLFVHQFL